MQRVWSISAQVSRTVPDMASVLVKGARVSAYATLALMEITAPHSCVQVQTATVKVGAVVTFSVMILL